MVARKSFTYDGFANVLTETETDWGVNRTGGAIRRKERTYVSDESYTHASERNGANVQVHLRRLLQSETVKHVKDEYS